MPRFRLTTALVICMVMACAGGAEPGVPESRPASAAKQVRNIQLINTSAAEAARLLNAIATQANSATGKGPATVDEKTNTVVVSGPREVVDWAADLLQKLDNGKDHFTGTSAFFIYNLQQAHASEVAAAMNRMFRNTVAPAATAPGTAATAPASQSAPARKVLAGVAYFVANPDTNSILVTTDTQFEEDVRAILKQLDRTPPVSPASQPKSGQPGG